MDFHLATPTGDVLLFSSEDGRTVQLPVDHIADVGEMVTLARPVSALPGE